MNSVDEETIMITVFGPRTTVGLVRFYSTGTAQQVALLLKSLQKGDHGFSFDASDITAAPIFADAAPPAAYAKQFLAWLCSGTRVACNSVAFVRSRPCGFHGRAASVFQTQRVPSLNPVFGICLAPKARLTSAWGIAPGIVIGR